MQAEGDCTTEGNDFNLDHCCTGNNTNNNGALTWISGTNARKSNTNNACVTITAKTKCRDTTGEERTVASNETWLSATDAACSIKTSCADLTVTGNPIAVDYCCMTSNNVGTLTLLGSTWVRKTSTDNSCIPRKDTHCIKTDGTGETVLWTIKAFNADGSKKCTAATLPSNNCRDWDSRTWTAAAVAGGLAAQSAADGECIFGDLDCSNTSTTQCCAGTVGDVKVDTNRLWTSISRKADKSCETYDPATECLDGTSDLVKKALGDMDYAADTTGVCTANGTTALATAKCRSATTGMGVAMTLTTKRTSGTNLKCTANTACDGKTIAATDGYCCGTNATTGALTALSGDDDTIMKARTADGDTTCATKTGNLWCYVDNKMVSADITATGTKARLAGKRMCHTLLKDECINMTTGVATKMGKTKKRKTATDFTCEDLAATDCRKADGTNAAMNDANKYARLHAESGWCVVLSNSQCYGSDKVATACGATKKRKSNTDHTCEELADTECRDATTALATTMDATAKNARKSATDGECKLITHTADNKQCRQAKAQNFAWLVTTGGIDGNRNCITLDCSTHCRAYSAGTYSKAALASGTMCDAADDGCVAKTSDAFCKDATTHRKRAMLANENKKDFAGDDVTCNTITDCATACNSNTTNTKTCPFNNTYVGACCTTGNLAGKLVVVAAGGTENGGKHWGLNSGGNQATNNACAEITAAKCIKADKTLDDVTKDLTRKTATDLRCHTVAAGECSTGTAFHGVESVNANNRIRTSGTDKTCKDLGADKCNTNGTATAIVNTNATVINKRTSATNYDCVNIKDTTTTSKFVKCMNSGTATTIVPATTGVTSTSNFDCKTIGATDALCTDTDQVAIATVNSSTGTKAKTTSTNAVCTGTVGATDCIDATGHYVRTMNKHERQKSGEKTCEDRYGDTDANANVCNGNANECCIGAGNAVKDVTAGVDGKTSTTNHTCVTTTAGTNCVDTTTWVSTTIADSAHGLTAAGGKMCKALTVTECRSASDKTIVTMTPNQWRNTVTGKVNECADKKCPGPITPSNVCCASNNGGNSTLMDGTGKTRTSATDSTCVDAGTTHCRLANGQKSALASTKNAKLSSTDAGCIETAPANCRDATGVSIARTDLTAWTSATDPTCLTVPNTHCIETDGTTTALAGSTKGRASATSAACTTVIAANCRNATTGITEVRTDAREWKTATSDAECQNIACVANATIPATTCCSTGNDSGV